MTNKPVSTNAGLIYGPRKMASKILLRGNSRIRLLVDLDLVVLQITSKFIYITAGIKKNSTFKLTTSNLPNSRQPPQFCAVVIEQTTLSKQL